MITHTLTSDPAIGLALGRRLALNARRQPRQSRLQTVWTRLFARQPAKKVSLDA